MKNLREAKGMTQNELAKAAGIPQSVLSDIENGKTKNPRIDTLEAIAAVLKVRVEDLRDKPVDDQ